MGRIFCSVVADDAGWHDATSGTCNETLLRNKPWSKDNYQQALNDFVRNGYDSFAIELGKYGLGARDLVANMNWFSRVKADDSGRCLWPSHTRLEPASVSDLKWTPLFLCTPVHIPSMTRPPIQRLRLAFISAWRQKLRQTTSVEPVVLRTGADSPTQNFIT